MYVKLPNIGGITPKGEVTLTENVEGYDVKKLATVNVSVPLPTETLTVTKNQDGIDVYYVKTLNVQIPTYDGTIIDT